MTQTSREIDLQFAVEDHLKNNILYDFEKTYIEHYLACLNHEEKIIFWKLGTLSDVAEEFYTQLNADEYEEHSPERG